MGICYVPWNLFFNILGVNKTLHPLPNHQTIPIKPSSFTHVSTDTFPLPFLLKTRLLWKSAKVLLAARTSAGEPHCNNCTWWEGNKLGCPPLPGSGSSPPGWHDIFTRGSQPINLHLQQLLGGGTTQGIKMIGWSTAIILVGYQRSLSRLHIINITDGK